MSIPETDPVPEPESEESAECDECGRVYNSDYYGDCPVCY